ncbi:site-2 protease family protein [Ammoniphilus sp. CFH 90114]|uniref:site-2 protease family protein n=1 Tax=Ammoniphilus sp. CFH 90114 TaxID=2493665 RepID=UPI00100FAE07|nr:site-2 protease family protein [Ammoniphilus sp. CFH 90114]RXT13521.1 site-2 protease family protein [Ammoniphilus sp. CFH 90114]
MDQYKKNNNSGKWKSFGGIIAFLVLFGGKLKFLLPLLKLGKFGGTIWSMALMIGAYAVIYPWSFAIGIVVMIFIHEMGHILAAKRKGIPVSAPAFIPFVGALITMKKQPVDAQTEAYLAFGGPVIGTLGALAALGLGVALDSPALLSVAQVGFFLNLINLIPVHPLDGGRIVTAISRWLWVVGLVGGLFVILYFKAIIFLIFWGMFAWELYKKYVRKDHLKDVRQDTNLTATVDMDPFLESGLPIPAESHQRELYFIQASDIRLREEYCHLYYPGLGRIASLPFESGIVERVRLMGTKIEEGKLKMQMQVTYRMYPENVPAMIKEEGYYQVPNQVRWTYGLSYIGLAVFLGWMMMVTYSMFTPPPLVG